mgnify:FL=1|jgi:hypothetical protein|tara:strand:+ start:35 stop:397 length:363 start_codon:yes stop_codon:yes gene_type:complete
MSAGKYDITIEQGSTLTLNLSYKNNAGAVLDLSSNYTTRMKIRESSGGTIIASTESADAPKNTLSVALAATGNNIIVTMAASDTAALDFDNAVYDFELVTGLVVERVIEGRVYLSKEITV